MNYDLFYTQKAQEMRDLAKRATTYRAKDEFLKLALEYDTLAEMAGENQPSRRQA
jgi:hypothetical protein